MSEPVVLNRGEILLYNNHAIGLQPDAGGIGLYKTGAAGWIIGIKLAVDLRHYRKAGSTSGFMTLDWLELSIPAEHGNYVGRIKGWEKYKTQLYNEYYKPTESQFLPGHTEWTTFAWLDAFDEEDPYFYFGWGLRTDNMAPVGYRRRMTSAYMGVNYPISDNVRPSFVEVPPEDWLRKNLKESIPEGQWELKAGMSSFVVDGGVMQDTHAVFGVVEGRSRFINGEIDFVKPNDVWVGEDDADLSGVFWGSYTNPGELKILSGPANGKSFRIIDCVYSGDDPSPGFPPKTWMLKVHPGDATPSDAGVTVGSKYRLVSPFNGQVYMLVEYYIIYDPGIYESENLSWKFTPII
jgi:hypothetical protein